MELNELILKEMAFLQKKGITFGRQAPKYYSTGSLNFDAILNGGYAAGHIHMIAGGTQMGKTTLSMLFVKNLLQEDPNAWVLYFDVERRILDEDIAKYDIDQNRFKYSDENLIGTVHESVRDLLLEGKYLPKAIIVDSLPFLIEAKDMTSSPDKKKVGGMASAFRKMFVEWHGAIRNRDTVILVLNSLHVNIGVPEWDLDHFYWRDGGEMAGRMPYNIIDVKYKKPLKNGTETIGWEFRPYTFKKQNGKPRQTALVKVVFENEGRNIYSVDTLEEVFELGKELKVFTKENGEPVGSQDRKLYYDKQFLGSSKEAIKEFLAQNVDMTHKIITEIQEAIQNGVIVNTDPENSVEDPI